MRFAFKTLPKIAREIVVSRELNKYEIDEAEKDRAVDEFLKTKKWEMKKN